MSPDAGARVSVSDVLQIRPECAINPAFGGCLFVVSELKGWGVMGYVPALGESRDKPGGQAYIRLKWEEVEHTGGKAVWIMEHHALRENPVND